MGIEPRHHLNFLHGPSVSVSFPWYSRTHRHSFVYILPLLSPFSTSLIRLFTPAYLPVFHYIGQQLIGTASHRTGEDKKLGTKDDKCRSAAEMQSGRHDAEML